MGELNKQRLLIIAAHPDDEILGCGGLISKIKEAGGKVHVLFLTNGTTKDFSDKGVSTAEERLEEIKKVAKYFSYDDYKIVFLGNDYHLRLDTLAKKDLMDEIERGPISLETINPTIVAFPSLDDYNQDHKVAAGAAFASCRPAPGKTKKTPKIIVSYEHPTGGWGLSEGRYHNFYVSLSSKNLNEKIEALKLYKSQVREAPHPRSLEVVESLAKYRGGLCGSNQAEAYHLHRMNF